MATKEEILKLRESTGNAAIFNAMYKNDSAFRATVDKYLPYKDTLSPVAKAKFPEAMLNKHYFGGFSITPTKPPTNTKSGEMYNAGMQQQNVNQNLQQGGLGQFAMETLKNTPSSFVNFNNGIWQAITHPLQTGETILRGAVGAGELGYEAVTGKQVPEFNPDGTTTPVEDTQNQQVAKAIGNFFMERYGSWDKTAETIKTDPVGFLSDVAAVATGVGGLAKGAANLGVAGTRVAAEAGAISLGTAETASRVASTAGKIGSSLVKTGINLEPAIAEAKLAGGAAKIGFKGASSVVNRLTGLDGKTVKFIAEHAKDFDPNVPPETMRSGIESTFQTKLRQFEEAQMGELPQYKALRETPNEIVMAENPLVKVLDSKGLKVTTETTKEGTVFRVSKSINSKVPLTPSEISKLEEFLNLVGDRKIFDNNQFFNVRGELTALSRFDRSGATTSNLNDIAREMRKAWNSSGRPQMKGLEQLDERFASIADELDDLSIGFAKTEDGRLALTEQGYKKLLNLTNRGNEQTLRRIQKYIPDIKDQINALRAVEDVLKAGENKVGTYTRAIVGAGGGAMVGGPLGAVAGLILSSPAVTVPLIRAYGRLVSLPKEIINSIVSKIGKGIKLSSNEAKTMGEAIKYFDNVDNTFKIEAENRLIELKGGQEGRAGIDRAAPLPEMSPSPKIPKELEGLAAEARNIEIPAMKQYFENHGIAVNPDNTVTVYHATTAENAASIKKSGFIRGGTGVPNGMIGAAEPMQPMAFAGFDKKWTVDTWGSGRPAVIEMKVPVNEIRHGAQNFQEAFFEGGLKKGADGLWHPVKLQDTFVNKLAVQDYRLATESPKKK